MELIGYLLLTINLLSPIIFVYFYVKLQNKISNLEFHLENECKNIRGSIELNKEYIESDIESIDHHLSDRILRLENRLSNSEITKELVDR